MRVRKARLFAVAAFYLFVHLGLAACSTSQEEQGDPEVTAEETSQEGGEEEAAVQGEEGGNVAVEGDNAAAEMPNGAQEAAPAEGEAIAEGQATTTEGEMQDIINSGAAGEQAPAETAVANVPADSAAPAADPAAAPAADPAAAPAADPAAAPAAPVAQAAPAAGGIIPEMGSKMPYIVQPGDTLGKIAAKIYGDQTKWKNIAQMSNVTNPNRIYPGDVVYYQLSQESVAFASSYESAPRSEVQAAAGDTLVKISAKVLGSPIHWRSIWRENGHIDTPDVIEAGTPVYFVDHAAVKSAMSEVKSVNTAETTEVVKSIEFSGALIALFSSMS